MSSTTSPLDWLMSTQNRGIQPGLQRMQRLLAALGNPQQKLRCLHVAGTNGKGSVSAFAESVLRASGHRTGLYTSPHLVDFSERIRIDGENANDDAVGEGILRIREVTEGWGAEEQPTFFELVTALAFDLFERQNCGVVVLETGLGGRLDATNTAPKLACAITPIALDHMEWLGGSLREIAKEKAGILRPGVPAVTAPQEPEVGALLAAVAEQKRVPLTTILEPLPPGINLGLAGSHQRMNAALALGLIRAAGFNPAPEAVSKGLGEVSWPGRFQRIPMGKGELILDGAHNLHAARQLASTWGEEYGTRRCTLIFGALTDKDPAALLRELIPIARKVILTPVCSPRGCDPFELERKMEGEFLSAKVSIHIFHTLSHALREAFLSSENTTEAQQGPVLLAGSLFLVGEALSLASGGRAVPRTQ